MKTIIRTNGEKIVIEGEGYHDDRCIVDLKKLVEELREYGVEVEIKEVEKKPEAYIKSGVLINE